MDTPSKKFAQSRLSTTTTPSEIYDLAYGDLAPEILKKARKYQSENPLHDYMRTPDYSDKFMESPIEVKPMEHNFARAMVNRNDLPTIHLRNDLYGSDNDPIKKNLSLIMHEVQHSIGSGDTPGTKKIERQPVDTLGNKEFLGDDSHAISSAELPAYIAQLKLQRFQNSKKYPSAENPQELIEHLKQLENKYPQGDYLNDVIRFLQESPETGIMFWNSVARRNNELNGLLA
jgi:hypothetical protein